MTWKLNANMQTTMPATQLNIGCCVLCADIS